MHKVFGSATGVAMKPEEMMNAARNIASENCAVPKLEIDREISTLRNRLNAFDDALSELIGRLGTVMRDSEPQKEGGTAASNPSTHLGGMIRSASDRVDSYTEICADIIRRLEIE